LTPTSTATVTATPTPILSCPVDCDRNGEVTVDELISAIGISLGSGALSECLNADQNSDGLVTIEEIIAGVTAALHGCP
jgi:hypothetical protein